jgi:hypothetical protein
MNQRLRELTAAELFTWGAFALAVACAVLAIAVPSAGTNRVQGAALPFAIGAAVLAASAVTWQRRTLGGLLYAAGALAILYGILQALSVPLRLAVEGTCPLTSASCPLGFEYPATSGENFAVSAVTICGAVAVVLLFIAFELRFLRKPRPVRDEASPQHSEAAPQHDQAAPQHDQAAPQHDQAAPQHDQAAPQHDQTAPPTP